MKKSKKLQTNLKKITNNQARQRTFWNPVELKYRNRAGHEATKAFNRFTGFYKNNE